MLFQKKSFHKHYFRNSYKVCLQKFRIFPRKFFKNYYLYFSRGSFRIYSIYSGILSDIYLEIPLEISQQILLEVSVRGFPMVPLGIPLDIVLDLFIASFRGYFQSFFSIVSFNASGKKYSTIYLLAFFNEFFKNCLFFVSEGFP